MERTIGVDSVFAALLLAPLEPGSVEEGRVELSNVGLYIGWLERLLVLVAVAGGLVLRAMGLVVG